MLSTLGQHKFMIVTINCNTSLDFIYTIPAWQPGHTLRASSLIQSIGGKTTDCSWVLAEMGITSLALGFAAGMTGEVSAQLLRDQGVDGRLHHRRRRVPPQPRDRRPSRRRSHRRHRQFADRQRSPRRRAARALYLRARRLRGRGARRHAARHDAARLLHRHDRAGARA